ncbi:hypothetical protein MSI_21790 [Treponema sp. JC4]|uniref:hypothetical protein n=1 Tax=Treponema sp. JC4 TaxID=1124982 RepID=UPI00025B0E6E|nr:hypothetical protein [Treponema sp. JC4]EID84346.1 hypothetical protein MSI_21790 [Treponema sp. JC4]
MANSDNPKRGKVFQQKVLALACKEFKKNFIEEKAVMIGKPEKEHRFDCVSSDSSIIIECKCYSWTKGNNVPSAKMSTLNEAVLYLRNSETSALKIIALKKDFSTKKNETLAQYYLRTYGHLLADIQIWEVDEDDHFYKLV